MNLVEWRIFLQSQQAVEIQIVRFALLVSWTPRFEKLYLLMEEWNFCDICDDIAAKETLIRGSLERNTIDHPNE